MTLDEAYRLGKELLLTRAWANDAIHDYTYNSMVDAVLSIDLEGRSEPEVSRFISKAIKWGVTDALRSITNKGKRKRDVRLDPGGFDSHEPVVYHSVSDAFDLQEFIDSAVKPPQEHGVLLMHLNGYSGVEIGLSLGLSPSRASQILNSAKGLMRSAIKRLH